MVILKQLRAHGDNTKKILEINLHPGQDSKDSVDFIGWYTNKTKSILKIPLTDPFKQYIAYHEGWGGYKNYKNNQKVILLAKKVENNSNKYKKQLEDCKSSLSTKKYIIF